MTKKSSRHLVAPELLAAIDLFPPMDFSQGMAPFRSGFALRDMPPLPPELMAVTCEERFIAGTAGDPDVRILLYTPPAQSGALRPAVLYIHGGGFVLGNPEMNDGQVRKTAQEVGCIVVSVDYRLAPETVWPGALHDNYAGLCWLRDNAETLGVDPSRIAVAGDSAGAGHAAALAIHARNERRAGRNAPAIRFQLIDYPMLDDRTCTTADPNPYTGEFVWTQERNHFGWKSLLGVEPGSAGVDETASPARAADLSDLPPAYISIGTLDLFVDESLEYTRRLIRAGVPAELHITPGGYHGSGLMASAPQSQQAAQLRMAALKRALAG